MAKGKAATKSAAKDAAKDAVAGATKDRIMEVAKLVEGLTEAKAHEMVQSRVDSGGFNDFALAGVLARIQKEKWFGEHETFQALIESEYQFSYRKAAMLTAMYNGLIEAGVSWAEVAGIGWSKLAQIGPILTPKNKDKWIKKAEALTLTELVDAVREVKKGKKPASAEGSSPTVRFAVRLHQDQLEVVQAALDCAKHEADTEFDAVGLEAICADYLAGGKKGAGKLTPAGLAKALKEVGIEVAVGALDKAFPDVTITVGDGEEEDEDDAVGAEEPEAAKKAKAPKAAEEPDDEDEDDDDEEDDEEDEDEDEEDEE